MELKSTKNNSHTVIELSENIDLYNYSEFKNMVFENINREKKSIVLDLQNVKTIDSSALSLLVSLQRKAKDDNIQFSLVNPSEYFLNVLRISQMQDFFTIYNNLEELPE
jgi:anti-anti-sigma factor